MSSVTFIVIGLVGAVWAVALISLPTTGPVGLDLMLHRLMSFQASLPEPSEDQDEAEMAQPFLRRLAGPLVASIGKVVVARIQAARLRELRRTIAQAGWSMSPEMFYVRRTLTLMAGLVAAAIVLINATPPLSILLAGGAAWGGFIAVPVALRSRLRVRAKQIGRELPGVLDLLTVAMEAGLSFSAALGKVCEAESGPLGQEFFQVLNEIRLGRPRLEALSAMADRNDVEDLSEVVHAVVQAEPLGVGLARVFRVQSEDTRRKRRQRAEEKGQKAPIKMLMPMLGCIFPTIFIMLLGPAAITVIHSSGGHP